MEMGEDRMYETIRFWTMSVAEYLDEYFETDVIKAAFSGSGIIGTALGIHSPGTAYVLLHHYMGEVDGNVGAWGFARGGMGAVSKSIASAFQAAGGELRTEAGVDKIIVRNGETTAWRSRTVTRLSRSRCLRHGCQAHVPEMHGQE